MLMVAIASAVLLVGCNASGAGPGGATTCAEYLEFQLSLEEQLISGRRSEEQEAIVKRMLADHNMDTSEANLALAETHITRFCGIGTTIERENSDRPIEDAIDW